MAGHRHKDSRAKWTTTDAEPEVKHPADVLTAVEVTALKQLLLAHGPGGGGTTPIPNPPQVPPPDITPPTITNVAISGITTSGAIVTCTTSEAATVVIEYGSTIAYGSQTAASSSGTSHSRTISGLTQNTLIHFRVRATDTAGNLRLDTDRTFTTASPSPPAPAGTFQDIINGVASGGSVDLTGWTGTGRGTISRPITITGGTLTVPAGGPGVSLFANGIHFDGFSMQGPNGTVYTGLEAAFTTRGGPAISGLVIEGGTISDFGYGGFWLDRCTGALLDGVTVDDCVYAGIMALSWVGGTIQNCLIHRIGVVGAGANSNNAYGIAISHNASPRSSDVQVLGNTVEDVPTWEAMDTHGGLRINFDGNTVRRSRRGVMVTGGVAGSQATDCVVNDNDFLSPVSVPVNDQYAVVLIASVSADVTNNTITGWGTPSPEPRAYLRQGDTGTTISGNTVTP